MRLFDGTDMGNREVYGASKGSLIQLRRWPAGVFAPKARVNTISLGGIFRNESGDFVKRYQSKMPLKRMAPEEDFLGVATHLCSDLSIYVTGQNISVDGGWGICP
jgi:NAD(P)-dependent dehydrogenase (short-subunit alcohol dehydrogenase family)